MSKNINPVISMILEELPKQDRKVLSESNLKQYLEKKHGKPQIISSSLIAIESVFETKEKKIGIIEDTNNNITGYSIYKGDIPEAFIQIQAAPCTTGYIRTTTVTTTSPIVVVSILSGILKAGAQLAALAMANLVTHATNVSTAKIAACAPCTPPCTCSAITRLQALELLDSRGR